MLPELWPGGFFAFDKYSELAENEEGPTVTMLRQAAMARDAYIHCGSYVEAHRDGLRNTTVVISPDGELVNRYSKVHGFGHGSEERDRMTPGMALEITPLPMGRVASTTCYDLRFPGLWSRIGEAAAEMVFVPAAWPAARRDHWQLLTSARAVENQCFVLACNAAGTQAGVELAGTSRIVSPWGRVIAEAGSGEEILTADIDPEEVQHIRAKFPVLQDRLEDYNAIEISGDQNI